jgi:hypothetical protein
MSDRHFELPAHPDLEYYRKQAKHLQRAYAAGDAAAQARIADVLGDRAAERFLLSDAQFVLAQEHGFWTWAGFRAHIQSRSTTDDRPVSRLLGMRPGHYASMAEVLLTDLRRNAPGALQRLRAYVPRHTAATDTSTAELRDARLIIARELGFPTWRELVSFTEKSLRDLDERQEKWRRLRPQAEALLAGDTGRLAGLTAEQVDTLLHMLAYREAIPGVRLGEELGVPRAAVDVLIGKATNLEIIAEAFVHACQHGRTEVVRWFLDPGVRPDVAPYLGRTGLHWAIHPRRAPPSRRRRLAAHLLRHSLARSRDPANPPSDRVPIALSYRCGCRAARHAYRPALPRHRAHAGPAPPASGSVGGAGP